MISLSLTAAASRNGLGRFQDWNERVRNGWEKLEQKKNWKVSINYLNWVVFNFLTTVVSFGHFLINLGFLSNPKKNPLKTFPQFTLDHLNKNHTNANRLQLSTSADIHSLKIIFTTTALKMLAECMNFSYQFHIFHQQKIAAG